MVEKGLDSKNDSDNTHRIDSMLEAIRNAKPEFREFLELPELRSYLEAKCLNRCHPEPDSEGIALPPWMIDVPDPLPATLLDQLERAIRPHRPEPLFYKDPMPRTDFGSLPSETEQDRFVDAFDAGFKDSVSLLKGAHRDGSLSRMVVSKKAYRVTKTTAGWAIDTLDENGEIPDLKGMKDLVKLLGKPGVGIPFASLEGYDPNSIDRRSRQNALVHCQHLILG